MRRFRDSDREGMGHTDHQRHPRHRRALYPRLPVGIWHRQGGCEADDDRADPQRHQEEVVSVISDQ